MRRVDIDVNELSYEDVNADWADEFGAFGAVHEEPEPMTSWELRMASTDEESKFYYGG